MPGWQAITSMSVRESYDANVYLQDNAPSSAIPGSMPARRRSFVTTAAATFGLEYRAPAAPKLALNYAPDAVRYHSAAGENHQVHRFALNVSRQGGEVGWAFQNTAVRIQGSSDGPLFGGAGGAPAVGGIPLRDRRDSLVVRSGLNLQSTVGGWTIAPLVTAYVHDFLTRQSRQAGYLNYIDRRELLAGCDASRPLGSKIRFVAGYRTGRQEQGALCGIDSPYDSCVRRLLVGAEAKLAWLQVNVVAGAERRSFRSGTPAGFDRTAAVPWIDGSATATFGPRDVGTITVRRFEQPAFASVSMYDDIVYEATWAHRFDDRYTVMTGFKAYGGKWRSPALREDWIYTPSAVLRCKLSRGDVLDLSYAEDEARSRVPATGGREFSRLIISVLLRHLF
jgi:hypothetical protein